MPVPPGQALSGVDLIILRVFNRAQWLVAVVAVLEIGALLVVVVGLLDLLSQV